MLDRVPCAVSYNFPHHSTFIGTSDKFGGVKLAFVRPLKSDDDALNAGEHLEHMHLGEYRVDGVFLHYEGYVEYVYQ